MPTLPAKASPKAVAAVSKRPAVSTRSIPSQANLGAARQGTPPSTANMGVSVPRQQGTPQEQLRRLAAKRLSRT